MAKRPMLKEVDHLLYNLFITVYPPDQKSKTSYLDDAASDRQGSVDEAARVAEADETIGQQA